MFTIDDYFYWSGVIATIIILLMLFIFSLDLFVWPLIEAISLCRMHFKSGEKIKSLPSIFTYWYRQLVFGRSFSSVSGKAKRTGISWRWNGVGDWQVNDNNAADREGQAKS